MRTRTIAQLVTDLRTMGGTDERDLTEFGATYPDHVNERLARAERPAWDADAGNWDADESEDQANHFGIPTDGYGAVPGGASDHLNRLIVARCRRQLIAGDRSPATAQPLRVFLGRAELKQIAAAAGMTYRDLLAL